jgi:magnesium chelatase family protein
MCVLAPRKGFARPPQWRIPLALDELPEFRRDVLEVMPQPLEEGHVTIARAAASLSYPARCIIVGAMNPCPCM